MNDFDIIDYYNVVLFVIVSSAIEFQCAKRHVPSNFCAGSH